MPERRAVFLTGATGLLGRYLFRDLLRKGRPVAILVRDSRQNPAAGRVAEILADWNDRFHFRPPAPVVLAGDLGADGLGLSAADRRWLGRHCGSVLHAAANLSFRETPAGEPWRTNVAGTESLLKLCRDAGLSQWHHVSTAFVCGQRVGRVAEDELDLGQSFHNPYEESKFHSEKLVRQTPNIHATVYRPSVIVGDSRTGYTSSFIGLYRFLELGSRLASMNPDPGRASLPLRLPLGGDEPWDLVPVDWVARAIVRLMSRPGCSGRAFHLVSRSPVSTRTVRDVGSEELNLSGVEFAGPGGAADPTRLEEMFLDGVREYWPYLGGSPVFDATNTAAALPRFPPPAIDRPMLKRLIRFAVNSRWGRDVTPTTASDSQCAEYIERVFPRQARRSPLAREAELDITVGIELEGRGGGRWTCKWERGELVAARRGLEVDAAVTYRTDTATFDAVVNGRQTPQEAFFEQRIAITGDVETALKLAVLFGQFLAEHPASQSAARR
jgi:thioester reductase-like protein